MEKTVKITVQPTLPGRRRNSPRPDTLCSDLANLTSLPTALFVADEAAIAVDVEGERRAHVRALIGVGPDDEFAGAIHLIATVPGVGMIEQSHFVKVLGTVEEAAVACAIAFAVGLSEALIETAIAAELLVLDHRGEVLIATNC